MKITKVLWVIFFSALAFSMGACADAQNDEVTDEVIEDGSESLVDIKINEISLSVELADEAHERALGLMYRQELCEQCGMLFRFERIRVASIWMKNTYIPLDVAFINAFGRITDIKALEPQDLTSVPSSVPVLYALEMNQGWFAKNGIKVGDTVEIPQHLK